MPARKPAAKAKPVKKAKAAPGRKGRVARTLPGAPKGKVSSAKLAVGDAPVKAYIAGLPASKRAIVQRFDDLAARTLPGLQRSIKWGMPFYGVGNGWFVSCGAFADHVKVSFLNGASLRPVPPVGTAKYVRGLDLESADELDERQVASWLQQAATMPGLGKSG